MSKQIPLPPKYPIPPNWKWVEMDHLVFMLTGFPFDSKKFSTDSFGRKPLIRIRNIVSGKTTTFTDESCPNEYIIQKGDILIGMDGDFNVAKWKSENALLNQRVCYIRSASEALLNDFLFYYLAEPLKKINAVTPSVTVKHLSTKTLKKTSIPLAPLAEQQRIIDRIESLFAKLDEAKEKSQEVIERFDDRRSAILSKAFSGELTNTWKESFIISSSKWTIKNFEDVAIIKSNLVDPADYQSYPHIAPDNIEKKTGRLLKYNTIAEDGVKSGKHRFYAGQILYSKIRPNLSKVVVIDFDGLCSADMYPIEAKPDVNTKFLWYYMLSDDFVLQASTAGSRSVLPKINQKELSSLKVRVTSLPEQERIVKILDSFFAKEQQAKETAEQVIEQIEVMKKAILARAFRGELGTNDPNDEPAVDLLRRVINS